MPYRCDKRTRFDKRVLSGLVCLFVFCKAGGGDAHLCGEYLREMIDIAVSQLERCLFGGEKTAGQHFTRRFNAEGVAVFGYGHACCGAEFSAEMGGTERAEGGQFVDGKRTAEIFADEFRCHSDGGVICWVCAVHNPIGIKREDAEAAT